MSSRDKPKPLNILSLDGGGVRGLSSLLILQELMDSLPKETPTPLRPCEVFDLICGTSTGGLIALLLGRLRMTVDQCIQAYVELSRDIFQDKKPLATARQLLGASMYGHTALETKVKQLVKNHDSRNTTLQDPLGERCCRTFVTAASANHVGASAVLFRTYKSNDKDNHANCEVWEAARATTAASTFFDPITISGEKFIDEDLGLHNNPSYIAVCEVSNIWPGRPIGLHLSLGTGCQQAKPSSDHAAYILRGCDKISTSCKVVHEIVSKHYDMQAIDNQNLKPYHRFSVDEGLEVVTLEEYTEKAEAATITHAYLDHADRQREFNTVVQVLRGRAVEVTRKTSP